MAKLKIDYITDAIELGLDVSDNFTVDEIKALIAFKEANIELPEVLTEDVVELVELIYELAKEADPVIELPANVTLKEAEYFIKSVVAERAELIDPPEEDEELDKATLKELEADQAAEDIENGFTPEGFTKMIHPLATDGTMNYAGQKLEVVNSLVDVPNELVSKLAAQGFRVK